MFICFLLDVILRQVFDLTKNIKKKESDVSMKQYWNFVLDFLIF